MMGTHGNVPLTNNGAILKGPVVYEETELYYQPTFLEMWKNTIQEQTGLQVEWQYKDGRFVCLHTISDTKLLLHLMRMKRLDIRSFQKKFENSGKPQ